MTLRRRNSTATSVSLTLSSTSSSSSSSATSSSDFSLLPLSYTSLKDLIPSSSANSPTAAGAPAGGEISIRNRLVKQAAYAYLQPMSASPESASDGFFRRVSDGVLRTPFFSLLHAACALIDFFCFCFL